MILDIPCMADCSGKARFAYLGVEQDVNVSVQSRASSAATGILGRASSAAAHLHIALGLGRDDQLHEG